MATNFSDLNNALKRLADSIPDITLPILETPIDIRMFNLNSIVLPRFEGFSFLEHVDEQKEVMLKYVHHVLSDRRSKK
jgi:hypothetical protein